MTSFDDVTARPIQSAYTHLQMYFQQFIALNTLIVLIGTLIALKKIVKNEKGG